MSLALTVGILIRLEVEDPEEFIRWRAQFGCLNTALEAAGLTRHWEPTAQHESLPWDCQMYGYSGIHYLRRIAAHVARGGALPGPGDSQATDDPAVRHYYSHPVSTQRFPHLMWHSDCEGFYVPMAFNDVIIAGSEYGVWGDFIGSAASLLEECATLARVLHIPLDLDGESEEVENAADYQGQGTQRWERYGIETYTCLRLMKACKLSLATGYALVFT